jgi:hypothetical protein
LRIRATYEVGGIDELDRDEVDLRGTPPVVLLPELVDTRLRLALVDEVDEVAFDMVRREDSGYIGCGEGCCDEVVML